MEHNRKRYWRQHRAPPYWQAMATPSTSFCEVCVVYVRTIQWEFHEPGPVSLLEDDGVVRAGQERREPGTQAFQRRSGSGAAAERRQRRGAGSRNACVSAALRQRRCAAVRRRPPHRCACAGIARGAMAGKMHGLGGVWASAFLPRPGVHVMCSHGPRVALARCCDLSEMAGAPAIWRGRLERGRGVGVSVSAMMCSHGPMVELARCCDLRDAPVNWDGRLGRGMGVGVSVSAAPRGARVVQSHGPGWRGRAAPNSARRATAFLRRPAWRARRSTAFLRRPAGRVIRERWRLERICGGFFWCMSWRSPRCSS